MRKVFEHPDYHRVALCQTILAERGIQTVIKNQATSSLAGAIPFTSSYPELWAVEDSQRERAMEILVDLNAPTPGTTAPEEWICEKCGERVEGTFAACWNCTTPQSPGNAVSPEQPPSPAFQPASPCISPKSIDGHVSRTGEPSAVLRFRILVATSAILYVVYAFLPWLELRWVTQETANGLSWNYHGAIAPLPQSIGWILALALFSAQIGLLFFSREARLFFVSLSALLYTWTIFNGMEVYTALTAAIGNILILADGAILALAFTSPLKERFELRSGGSR